jgi:hypothetical protein
VGHWGEREGLGVSGPSWGRRSGTSVRRAAAWPKPVPDLSGACKGSRLGGPHVRGSDAVCPLAARAGSPVPGVGPASSAALGDHPASPRRSTGTASSQGKRRRPALLLAVREARRRCSCSRRSLPSSRASRSASGGTEASARFGASRQARRRAGPLLRRPDRSPQCGAGASRAAMVGRSSDPPIRRTPPSRGSANGHRGVQASPTGCAPRQRKGFAGPELGKVCHPHLRAKTRRARLVHLDGAAGRRNRPLGDGLAQWCLSRSLTSAF